MATFKDQKSASFTFEKLRARWQKFEPGCLIVKSFVAHFPTVPTPDLKQSPLIDGEWVDQVVIELAEFGELLLESGLKIVKSKDLFGWCIQKASAGSGADPENLLYEACDNVAAFNGRTKEFTGRPYINLSDYLTWPGRRLWGKPCIEEGILYTSMPQGYLRHADAKKSAVKSRGSKPKPHPADVRGTREHRVALAKALTKLFRDIRSATALHRACGDKYFGGRGVLYELQAELISASTRDIDWTVHNCNSLLVDENDEKLPDAEVDFDEAAQSAQKEGKRQLELLVKQAESSARKWIEPACNRVRRVAEERKKNRHRPPSVWSFP